MPRAVQRQEGEGTRRRGTSRTGEPTSRGAVQRRRQPRPGSPPTQRRALLCGKKKKGRRGKSQPGGGRSQHGPRAPLVHPRSNSRVPTNGSRGPRSRNPAGRQFPVPSRKANPGALQTSARTFSSFSPSPPPFPLQLVFTFSRRLPESPHLDAFSKVIPSHSQGRKPHSWSKAKDPANGWSGSQIPLGPHHQRPLADLSYNSFAFNSVVVV